MNVMLDTMKTMVEVMKIQQAAPDDAGMTALEQVLAQRDSEALLRFMKMNNPALFFFPYTTVKQETLLNLIQECTFNLNQNPDIYFNWLESALLDVRVDDDMKKVTKRILTNVINSVDSFLLEKEQKNSIYHICNSLVHQI